MRLIISCLFILMLYVTAQYVPTPTATPPSITISGQLGYGTVTSATWSDDGQLLAVGQPDEIRIYRIGQSGPLVIPSENTIRMLVFRPDHKLLASADSKGMVRVWDTATGTLIATWDDHGEGRVNGLYFMPGSDVLVINFFNVQALVAGSTVETGIWFWEFRTTNLPRIIATNGNSSEENLAFNRDFRRVLTVSFFPGNDGLPSTYSGQIRDAASGNSIGAVLFATAPVREISFSPTDPDLFMTLDTDGIVRFWQLSTLQERFALTLPNHRVTTAAFNIDGTELATSGPDGEVRIWEVATGTLLQVYRHQPENVDHLRFEVDGTLLAYDAPNDEAKVWDARTLEMVTTIRLDRITPPIIAIAFDTTAKNVIGLCQDGTIRAWSIADNRETTLVSGALGDLAQDRDVSADTAISVDGAYVAVIDPEDGVLRVWDTVHTRTSAEVQITPSSRVLMLVFSDDESKLYLASYPIDTGLDSQTEFPTSLREWSIGTDGQLSSETVLAEVDGLALSLGHGQIAYEQGTNIHLRDLSSRSEMLIPFGDQSVYRMRFTPDGNTLVVFYQSKAILWNVQTAIQQATILTDVSPAWNSHNVDFSPDGRYIAYTDGWNLRVSNMLTTMSARALAFDHYVSNSSLAFSPDGQRIATASDEGTIRLWEVR